WLCRRDITVTVPNAHRSRRACAIRPRHSPPPGAIRPEAETPMSLDPIIQCDKLVAMDIREIIRGELERQGMTQTRLAELAHMTVPRVNDYIHGKRDVTGETLGRMLDALGLTIKH